MSDSAFAELEQLRESEGASAVLDSLIDRLHQRREYHRLFDALLLKEKHEMGLPTSRPTSFDDVPPDMQQKFEQRYVDTARHVGELFLGDRNIPQAWLYFRTIREPEKVNQALEEIEIRRESDEQTEQLIQIALYEGAHPRKGLELMLATHGTCNTITAVDQQMHQMSPGDRRQACQLLARHLYGELCYSIRREVEHKIAVAPPDQSVRELIAGRDWLFEGGNYHVDVSHLNAVVRFCRFLEPADSELEQAIQLAEYGSRLSSQFQYAGDPPFEDFYPAHIQFFKALSKETQEEGLGYFRRKLESESDAENKTFVAYVLVDLLNRCDRLDEAVDVAAAHLTGIDESSGFSFAQLCQQAGRMDSLRRVAEEKGDLVMYTAALVEAEPGDGRAVSESARDAST